MNAVVQLAIDNMANLKPALFETGKIILTSNIERWAQKHLPVDLLKDGVWVQILVNAHTRGVWSVD